ncbi:predicted protein [Chaetomium globosum CBS 148.51]|uniref:Uncharacterized protein n=1 Tax=Chaetomium globosum (strain ATCC 6205 / CBS 148.51 / DSM 1962 / NBRC 6347 / NRRL 1970) TaxID=306901 RepID=Q2H1N5_CHAGB|nr:uncharacterized protein CHGG_04311 [Chaetomium globosum CBS 148.51]EAQ87692.1 predicted protein [Chaetomium globosum CBS 148.51]
MLLCPEELAVDDECLEVGLGSGGARTVCWGLDGLSAVGPPPVYKGFRGQHGNEMQPVPALRPRQLHVQAHEAGSSRCAAKVTPLRLTRTSENCFPWLF